MAVLHPCEKCRKLATPRKKLTKSPGTLQRVKRRPDIGQVPDIAHDAEYRCVICDAILTQTTYGASHRWRFAERQ
jgi:hypothetical protein